MARNTAKDAAPVILTEDVRQVIEEGGWGEILQIGLSDLLLGHGEFRNPRQQTGFDPVSMGELRADIAAEGLLKNLLVRPVIDPENPGRRVYQVIAGERRTRAIRQLVAEDAEVRDSFTGEFRPASQVYRTVSCLVRKKCDDQTATRLAFMENASHVPLSEAEVIDLCLVLESQDQSRKQIGDLLNRSPAWLSHTLGFATRLEPATYKRLRDGEISRSVAIKIMEYDPGEQVPVVKAAAEIATERHEQRVKRATDQAVSASEAQDTAFRERMDAERDRRASARDLLQAEERLARSRRAAEESSRRKEKIATAAPVLSQTDVAEGAHRVGLVPRGNRTLSTAQIREHYLEPANALLEGDLADPDSDLVFARRDVELVVAVAHSITIGNRDLAKVLRVFYAKHPAGGLQPREPSGDEGREVAPPSRGPAPWETEPDGGSPEVEEDAGEPGVEDLDEDMSMLDELGFDDGDCAVHAGLDLSDYDDDQEEDDGEF